MDHGRRDSPSSYAPPKLDDSVLTGEKGDFHTRAGQGPGRGEKLLEETGNRSRELPVVMRTNE